MKKDEKEEDMDIDALEEETSPSPSSDTDTGSPAFVVFEQPKVPGTSRTCWWPCSASKICWYSAFARVTSCAAPLLMTCTTYSGTPTWSAIAIARCVALSNIIIGIA